MSAGGPSTNLRAFLDAIGHFESRGDYRVLYGGATWAGDLSDHPANQGWPGVQLPDRMCKNAGLKPPCYSTAAGKYQIIKPTWNRVRKLIQLENFEPENQDAAATQLIIEAGALSLVEAGKFRDAINRVRRIWASMPAAGYGQGEHSMEAWIAAYTNAGGNIA